MAPARPHAAAPRAAAEPWLLPAVAVRVAVEQPSPFGWRRDVGVGRAAIGMRTFGGSAPLEGLQQTFSFRGGDSRRRADGRRQPRHSRDAIDVTTRATITVSGTPLTRKSEKR